MNRRTFLFHAGILAIAGTGLAALPARQARAAFSRTEAWKPSTREFLISEWRYAAGRITSGGQDYGFIVSIGMTRSSEIPFPKSYSLLVERQDFTGAMAFSDASYAGTRTFDASSQTYTFTSSEANATWAWDEAAQRFRLNLNSPVLSFTNLEFQPYGTVIPEGGTGTIDIGETKIGETKGVVVGSEYYADWNALFLNGAQVGVARLDMQCLYPTSTQVPNASDDYDHHWFAVAGETSAGPVFVSAWRIESVRGPRWTATIAQGSGANWQVLSLSETTAVAQLLEVVPRTLQSLPGTTPQPGVANQTGQSWHFQAGQSARGDLLDLRLSVPPGQFISPNRVPSSGTFLLESVGFTASGTVRGLELTNVRVVVGESTAEFAEVPADLPAPDPVTETPTPDPTPDPTPGPLVDRAYLPFLGNGK